MSDASAPAAEVASVRPCPRDVIVPVAAGLAAAAVAALATLAARAVESGD
jgi:hypothetical protein